MIKNSLKNFLKFIFPHWALQIYRKYKRNYELNKISSIEKFEYKGSIKDDLLKKYNYRGELTNYFNYDSKQIIHKWHHYYPIYDQYFKIFKEKKNLRFLEIGVSKGGSMNLWRNYFDNTAVIYGIDINPECKKFNGIAGQVRIGSQEDENFLSSIIDEMGGVDIVLDDGSHQMPHVLKSFNFLFPKLSQKGIYVIEDLHTAYWKDFGGGLKSKNNFFNFLRTLIDDMHHWYNRKKLTNSSISKNCKAIHIYDSIVIIEKENVHPPVTSKQNIGLKI